MSVVGTRRVLVTGGGSGIGRAVVDRLCAGGARVVVVGRRADRLDAACAAWPGQVWALPCDLGDPTARTGLVARARDLLGGLDGLVHSAGNVVHQPPGHIDETALRAQIELNLIAPLRLGEEALSVLDEGGGVVFVASTLAWRPVRTSAAYSAAKAGLLAAMASLALEGAPRRVRFNAVAPGLVDTEMIRALRLAPGEPVPAGAAYDERLRAQLDALRGLHPLGRLGTPDDVAAAIVHLLGAPWCTGSTLRIDGGLLLRE